MKIFKSRLFLKILLSYVALLLVFLFIVDYFVSQRVHGNYMAQEGKRLASIAQVLAAGLPQSDHPEALQPWAEKSGRQSAGRQSI
jgi:hypothetical protein